MSLPGDQVPVSIVPRTKARISFPKDYVKLNWGHDTYTFEQVATYIQDILEETLRVTIKETEEWIDQFVPKRSGDLRKSLKHFLNRSIPPVSTKGELRGVRLILGAGEDVKYASYISAMTDEQVQHENTWLEHSGRKAYSKGRPVLLDDPNAIADFFNVMVEYSVGRLKINLLKIKWLKVRSNG